MRILAIADIHGVTGVYEWLPDAISHYAADALILAGDLMMGGWEDEQSEQARTLVVPILKTIPVPVFFIMGNDDHIELEPGNEKIQSVHGRRLRFGGFNIVGYQYSPPFIGSRHEKPEEEMPSTFAKLSHSWTKTPFSSAIPRPLDLLTGFTRATRWAPAQSTNY